MMALQGRDAQLDAWSESKIQLPGQQHRQRFVQEQERKRLRSERRDGVEDAIAIMVSGQCSRFLYRDQPGPFFTNRNTVVDVYIVLHCPSDMIQPFFGTIDPPPYMEHGPNVQDIEYWYRTVKGARNVFVSIVDDQTMDAAEAYVTAAAISLHGIDYSKKPADDLNDMLSLFPTWRTEVRKLYLRHAVPIP